MRGVGFRGWSMAFVGVMAVTACGGGSGGSNDAAADAGSDTTAQSTDTAAASGGPTTTVQADPNAGAQIRNYTFTITGAVAAGTPLTVTNKDQVTHTFTNPDGAFNVEVPAGGTAQVTVAAAGTYKVVCTIHSSMGSQLVVV